MSDGRPKRGFDYVDAAHYLGIGPDFLKKLVRDSHIPVRYFNSKPILAIEDLDAYMDSRPSEKP